MNSAFSTDKRFQRVMLKYLGEFSSPNTSDSSCGKQYIYVIEAENGWIKIGNSRDPEKRVKLVLLHSPIPVRLIAKWEGRVADELKLHSRYEKFRSHSEWFRNESGMIEFIEDVFGIGLPNGVLPWEGTRHHCESREERQRIAYAQRSRSMKKAWQDPARKAQWVASIAGGRRNAAGVKFPAKAE